MARGDPVQSNPRPVDDSRISFYRSDEPPGTNEYSAVVEEILDDPDRVGRFRREALVRDRNSCPDMLDVAEDMGFHYHEVAAVILNAWSLPEWPERQLGIRRWVDLFKRAGYVTDCDLPQEDLTVYRGATRERWRGMAWTTDREQAEWFAQRTTAFGAAGLVFETQVPARHVLGRTNARDEAEVIVNPYGILWRSVVIR